MKIQKKIQSFCKENQFDLANKSILVATSGGVDSMILIDILSKIDSIKKIGIAHCNFSLRGEESNQDEEFVKKYANQNNISFHSIKFNTKQLAEERQKSIQLIARELRYDFFEEISQQYHYDFVATAHHLSDSLETSIYHLTKGTGIAGIRGILPKRKIFKKSQTPIIRPLLCLTKEEIRNYAIQNGLKWREDASNQTEKYKRNFIRHQIIPRLKEINPDTEKTFLDTSQRLRSMENLLQFHVNQFEKTILMQEDKSNLIQVSEIKKLIEPLLIISDFLKKKGFTYKQAKQIIEQLENSDQKEENETKNFISKSHILYTSKNEWILVSQKKIINDDKEFLIDINFNEKCIFQNEENKIKLTLKKCNPKEVDFKSEAMYLDFDKLDSSLLLRKWKNGDKFIPLGMKNKKNVGDFLTDLKIPIYQRSFVYVLLSKNEISWVGIIEQNKAKGLRIGNNFKLNKFTKNAVKVD
ncbi:tRNA(Ile)-lysidine synthetase [Bernardetia litoralis DSM 6794]|uniref:tRNA(Ile)-lysidine synthase n=1 Tax=Bernardetia litoralis (strain ATCC 23117 / DSM 6794 / NBRC 15988 / NCIMB 1366 / Fx l1 / Sio-4) TaxID=880071 RepID=I4AEY4_BERLS|nr:tRNA lysidine(34) synthetase TilS [Bernardetia litoralis]AFM02519.1 tRNA(Ile)-lysidine synthetase [Bernardetia litoralis DSM 6794]